MSATTAAAELARHVELQLSYGKPVPASLTNRAHPPGNTLERDRSSSA